MKKAFTLIEVMLSVAILSVALVMILQAFAHFLSILRIAEDNLTGTLIAGNKMAEAQILAKEDWSSFENGVDEKFKLDNIKCDWEIDLTPVEFETEEEEDFEEGATLNEVDALLSWEEGKRKGVISLATYMRSFSRDK
ncbi:MAG: type II secretion system protein [Candidatus Orphnella occulta]|nr:type II secretion system protein [Candidatus Orphnella occulta]MDP8297484.1 type II secretion system protein [Candidatus Orphnella occulta]